MKITVVAPGRPIDPVVAARAGAFAAIAYPEVDLIFHPQCFESAGHFAGSDALRAATFLSVANDPAVDAVWFARGGYGSNRILAEVMPKLGPAAARKAYAGYSDMGFLLGALYARRIGRPVHAPMATDINRNKGDETVARTLGWLVRGDRQGLEPDLGGRPAAAFNLAILDALIGTPWLPDLTDHVLMIEEVSEALYRVDRMMFHLTSQPSIRKVAGIRLGRVSDVTPNDPDFGLTAQEIVRYWCRRSGIPFLGKADIGHDGDNKIVPFG